ncbi:11461_t:CDS:10 [Paraglomus brasilianum]|uniref:11461_t:CDS:1 n=1 Tax=Paraglomus brasilianum TaxID=144538 RepID=A0A9N9G7C6_9GLOM|nr:11461_t:CDS:10 [Paraglomus brasilianum]
MVQQKRKVVEGSKKTFENTETEPTIEKIGELERGIAQNKANYNDILTLLELTEHQAPKVIHASIHALYRIFTPLLSRGELLRPKKVSKDDTDKATIALWLRDNYVKFVNRLCELLKRADSELQISSLKILLDLLKTESIQLTSLSGTHHFANNHYYRVVESLLNNHNFNDPLRKEFVEKYFGVYDDLRFYFLKDAVKVINNALDNVNKKDNTEPILKKSSDKPDVQNMNILMENIFSILEKLRTMPTEPSEIDDFWTGHPTPNLESKPEKDQAEEDNSAYLSSSSSIEDESPRIKSVQPSKKSVPAILTLAAHKRAFNDCWLALLKLPMTEESYKKILLMMHKKVIPHMTQPTMLMDFLTQSYDAGGVISLLALNGLFTLIHEHNLDYPDFYKKLYSLFDRDLMHVKYQSRFFRLADLFLASTHLPVQLIASFIKRMSRLALASPPHGIIIILPMIYNLIKKHPACMALIHRANEDGQKHACGSSTGTDPYDFYEQDPMKTGAIDSSLWELKTLQEHYYPNIATLAKIFQEKFTKPNYNLEGFLDNNYTTLFEIEMNKKSKKNRDPPLAFEKPKSLFPDNADEDSTAPSFGLQFYC